MIKQLLYKWFGLEDLPCNTCEVLKLELERAVREKNELLHKLLEKDKPVEMPAPEPVHQPIRTTLHVPFRVREQLIEAERREKIRLMKEKEQEVKEVTQGPLTIENLEKELGVSNGNVTTGT